MLSQLCLELLEPLCIERGLTVRLPEALLGRHQLLALTCEALLRRRQQLVHMRAALVFGDLERAPRFDLLEAAVHLGVRLCRGLELLGEYIRALGGTASFGLCPGVPALELLSLGALLRERGLRFLQCDTDLRQLGDERLPLRLGSLHLLGRAVEVSLTFRQTLLQQLDAVVSGL